jgi:hypothetical protein
MCGGVDHHRGDYTPQQRADLDRVLEFNRRMAERIDAGIDVAETEAWLDPDPLRYMWVDEGQGRIAEVITKAHAILDGAAALPGHQRLSADVVAESQRASRPSVSQGGDGTRLVSWLEWVPERGDVVRAQLTRPGAEPLLATVSAGVHDVFRPTALVSADGVPWVFYGSSIEGRVAVWATRFAAEAWSEPAWSEPALVSDSGSPAFNQEAVAHADGSVELCWQGRDGAAFAIWSRRCSPDGAWAGTTLVSDPSSDSGEPDNVWDPSLAAFADGSTAYAWSQYRHGSYRIMVRLRDAGGLLGRPRPLTSGRDYALHPHLAVTGDQRLWCAFDVITVSGHGGSGPTKLRPAGDAPGPVEGMRAPGDSVPPELLPEVSAGIRVVLITADAVIEAPGELASRHDVVPSGLPKLVATAGNGLSVVYRIHRRLPLMTYYWEVAVQSLTADGWGPESTIRGTDGTLEEAGVTAGASGLVIVAQTDGRLEHALEWTEGFGGRECPYLLEHQGSVIWHGIHGVGVIVLSELASAGPVPALDPAASAVTVHADDRVESRRWFSSPEPMVDAESSPVRPRYTTDLGDREYTLYWGDLHRHSLVSRCTAGDEPSLEDFYRYAWDVCEYDFWAVTDHSENSTDYQWWSIQKMADLFHVPGRFVPFYGFEWTSADHGHQNVIYGDVARGAPIFSAFADGSTDPAGLWAGLDKYPDHPAITVPHHPGSAMVHNDWDYFDPRYSTLVEIFQACRGNYEGPGAFRQYSDAIVEGTFTIDGLMRGHKFGLIASSDHGHGASYVGAFAESLSRGCVFDALQNRRTFAATTRDVIVDVRLEHPSGPVFLGEEAVTDGPRTFTIHAEGYTELARVDIVRNGSVAFVAGPDPDPRPGRVEVALRLEWGGCERTTVWDGVLSISGGEIIRTPFVGPEVVSQTAHELTWQNTTHSFGELYGAQRGGIDLTLTGPPDAVVSLICGDRLASLTLASLLDGRAHEIPGPAGHFRLQPGIGGLRSLGTREVDLSWTDPSSDPAFYYVRVFQIDGEMAWSSPIWATPSPNGAPV